MSECEQLFRGGSSADVFEMNGAKITPAFQGKLEAQQKLKNCFKEFHESFIKTKQAFLVFKTKSFFYPDQEFTKTFTKSIKQIEIEVKEMGSSFSRLTGYESGIANTKKTAANSVEEVKTENPELHNSSDRLFPAPADVLVKANEDESITPPVSEAGNDDEAPTSANVPEGKTKSNLSEKKRTYQKQAQEKYSLSKRRRRSLMNDYAETSKDKHELKDGAKESNVKEETEYEVENIIDFKKCQGQYFYKVCWRGYDPKDSSWEPSSNLTGCEDLLLEFYKSRLKEQEITETNELNYQVMPHDPHNWHLIQKALFSHISKPSQKDYQEGIAILVSSKLPAPKTQKEIKEVADKALAVRKKDKYHALLKTLVVDSIMKELGGKRENQLAQLRTWERNMNRICSDPAKLIVENHVDLELPPMDFIYINECIAGEGVTIPSDPVVGCECTDCATDHKSCCPNQMTSWLAYNKQGRLKVSLGTPIYECNKLCKCGPSCINRVVQKGRNISLCIFRTANGRGWGVKAMENIKKDSLVTEYVGEIITSDEAERRGKIYDAQGCTYLFDLDYDKGDQNLYTIDAAKCGNVSHFINHSCDPNLVVFNVWVNCLDPDLPRLALFATRDIKKWEELTFDYNSGLNSSQMASRFSHSSEKKAPFTPEKSNRTVPSSELILKTPKGNRGLQYGKTECHCGSANCRKYFF
nr:histone-lysine N-methyltransferase SUV39H2-like [Procambarus clarkii]